MKEYIIDSNRYLIPEDKIEKFETLLEKLPGWMGMYIYELEEDWKEYIIKTV
jgi:hypothetical protein